ncbi:MAG: hypothetical protein ACJ782_08080, partial [Actinomycetota bacterium]
MAVKIQPMALPGRWATIKAPMTMNALTPTSSTRKPAGSCWKLPLATERMVVTTMLMTNSASSDKATQVQHLRTVPPRSLVALNRILRTGPRSTAGPSQDRYERPGSTEPEIRAARGSSVKDLSDGPP